MEKSLHETKKPKHVLSVLRKVIGASLADSKSVLGLAPDTVKSIQSGRLPFSDSAALIVSEKTGVSCKWLLELDGSKPPRTESGAKYTRETFDRHEANRDKDAREWLSPANLDTYRYRTIKNFRTLTAKLAGLILLAHASQKVAFVDAKLEREIRRLSALLRQPERARAFEREVLKQVDSIGAENDAGMVTIFNQFKKGLPPAHSLEELLQQPVRG